MKPSTRAYAAAFLLLCTLFCCLARPVQSAPPASPQTTDLEGTVQYGEPAAPDAGAHVYLVESGGEPVTSANLDAVVAKAFRHEDADSQGHWRIAGVYPASYRVVVVSAHTAGLIYEEPLVLSLGEYTRVINHTFK